MLKIHELDNVEIDLNSGHKYAIRDIANGDYISGAVRMLDAVLIFLSIAIGMGVMFMIYHSMTGGVMP